MKKTILFLVTVILSGCSSNSSESNTSPNTGPSGTLDSSFGNNNGITIVGFNGTPTASAIQTDGKSIVLGTSYYSGQGTITTNFITKLNADGTLDSSFSYDGNISFLMELPSVINYNVVVQTQQTSANAVAFLPGNKIIVSSDAASLSTYDTNTLHKHYNIFALKKFNTDGSVDASFGTNGTIIDTLAIIPEAIAVIGSGSPGGLYKCKTTHSINVNADGSFVVAATTISRTNGLNDQLFKLTLVKYNADGSRYNSFGISGKSETLLGIPSTSFFSGFYTGNNPFNATMITDVSNRLIVETSDPATDYRMGNKMISRFNNDGLVDTSFGVNGQLKISPDLIPGLNYNFLNPILNPLAVQSTGNLIVGGGKNYTNGELFYSANYLSNGLLESSFGTNGSFSTTFGTTSFDQIVSIGIQSNGKIVLLGYTYDQTYNKADIALCRLNPNGSLDTSFGNSGKMIIPYPSVNANVGYFLLNNSLIIDSNDKINIFLATYEGFAQIRLNR